MSGFTGYVEGPTYCGDYDTSLPSWKRAENHHYDLVEVLQEEGCLNKDGQWVRINTGVSEKFFSMGHDSFVFETCRCRTDRLNELGMPEDVVERVDREFVGDCNA